MPAEEPLDRWAARRAARLRPVGARKAITLAPGSHAAHVNPMAPRLALEWNGYSWEPVGVCENYRAASHLLSPSRPADQVQVPGYAPARAGTGRHRKP
ncbi:DUF6087 family protein [Streptacidiphilus sp. EB103A]|uniref:DUF6087 family protein n=1 Tax=Streptacidiphilus sp. EB103A TaxID=3156275 RepID=UPI003512FE2A